MPSVGEKGFSYQSRMVTVFQFAWETTPVVSPAAMIVGSVELAPVPLLFHVRFKPTVDACADALANAITQHTIPIRIQDEARDMTAS